MPTDAPDYSQWIQTVEIVGTTPVATQATTETPISDLVRGVTSSLDYITLINYTVPVNTVTVLYGVEMTSDTPTLSLFRLTIKGVVQWGGQPLPTALNVFFSEARLKAGDSVKVEVKSSDGTQITAWAHLEGKEVS